MKRIIIAGISSSIGAVMASQLAEQGYDCVIVDDAENIEVDGRKILLAEDEHSISINMIHQIYEPVGKLSSKWIHEPEEWQKKHKRWKSR